MEQNFQTSFIPKKPMIEERVVSKRPIGISALVSLLVFFTVVLAAGGLYFYNGVLKNNVKKLEGNLVLAQDRFEPSKIVQLQQLDKRLNSATQILGKHISISPIFEALGEITLKTISFTKFSYSMGDGQNSKVAVKMSGKAVGYQSVALQSDLFAKNKSFLNPIFSNLVLDDTGNVVFDLEFQVDPVFIDYENIVQSTISPASELPDSSVLN